MVLMYIYVHVLYVALHWWTSSTHCEQQLFPQRRSGLHPPSPPPSLCDEVWSSLLGFVSHHRWRDVSSEPTSVKIIYYTFISVFLMWLIHEVTVTHPLKVPCGASQEAGPRHPPFYIQQSDPTPQNRALLHQNGSCGYSQFSCLQVTNMCLCRSVSEAKQQSDEGPTGGKLYSSTCSFWEFSW